MLQTQDPPAEPRGPATALAAGALAAAVAATTVSAVLDSQVDGAQRAVLHVDPGWLSGLPGPALATAGLLVLSGRPRHALGWVLSAVGLWWALDGTASAWLVRATAEQPPLAGASLAFWVYQRLGAGLLLLLPLVLLLYPSGHLPRGRWRVAAVVSLAATALLPALLVTAPARVAQDASGSGELAPSLRGVDLDLTTLPLPDGLWSALLHVAYPVVPVSLVVPFVVVVRRYRRARGLDRTRMRWLLWAAVVDLLVMLTVLVLPTAVSSIGLTLAVVVTAASVAVGIVRPRLVDVDRLLGGTVLYAGLLLAVLAIDAALLGAAGWLLGDRLDSRQSIVLAAVVVTAVYAPLRHQLWRVVRRWVLGQRDDPYRVVSALAERLEVSDASEGQLLEVARAVAAAFRSSYVAVEVQHTDGQRVTAEHGTAPRRTRALPITYRGEHVGRLLLPDGGGLARLSRRDERLLGDVVRQAAAASRASQLAPELQRSREQLVTAREEERRRLRRDLHDGLGPALAAVAMRIETARNTVPRSPADADRLLDQARADVAGVLDDVRRLVHDLRPPALDDVGLVGAVRQQADRLAPRGLVVRVDGGELGALPAAVEVAAYRIASEALTNVVRHAGAEHCVVRLHRQDGELVVEVRDDGAGIAGGAPAGVGLVSLRERAAELGGWCVVTCPDEGGTTVRAGLPLASRVTDVEVSGG
ncbi:MAG TPA: histidine kinase [Angustibacter sp.]|nr:histidine kinase [Angustibacter sp.]